MSPALVRIWRMQMCHAGFGVPALEYLISNAPGLRGKRRPNLRTVSRIVSARIVFETDGDKVRTRTAAFLHEYWHWWYRVTSNRRKLRTDHGRTEPVAHCCR